MEHKGQPTVILAKTIKGYGLGEAGEGRNVSHQQKKMNEKELREFRARFGIPIGAKKKDAAWEFMKWANSKDLGSRMVKEKGYGSPTRVAVIRSPEFKQKMTVHGVDVASIYERILDLGGKGGYMMYRIVPVFPQVGDKINKAVEAIASNQMSAEAAMKQAQQEAIEEIKKEGVKIE